MIDLFLTVLNMSFTASAVIIVVLLARLALRKAPKVFSYALWAVVLFRLLCPFTIEGDFALIPDYVDIRSASLSDRQEVSRTKTANEALDTFTVDENPMEPVSIQNPWPLSTPTIPKGTLIVSSLWLAGVVALLGYSVWSMIKLRRKLVGFVRMEGENDVRLIDHISSPFVLGLFSPKIYLPSDLPENEQDYILLHERTHIRRMDHISRALAWLALTIHWFNPLVWLAFYLAGKDMEMSCDEAVLRKMDRDIRTDFSTSLLRLSVAGNLPAGPLAFGGGDLKRRIKNILSYKKPALWIPVLALMGVLTMGAGLTTDSHRLAIDPLTITSVASIAYVPNPNDHLIYTADHRRQDVLEPTNVLELSGEAGAELVHLINSYYKTVYAQGDFASYNSDRRLFRINCADKE